MSFIRKRTVRGWVVFFWRIVVTEVRILWQRAVVDNTVHTTQYAFVVHYVSYGENNTATKRKAEHTSA